MTSDVVPQVLSIRERFAFAFWERTRRRMSLLAMFLQGRPIWELTFLKRLVGTVWMVASVTRRVVGPLMSLQVYLLAERLVATLFWAFERQRSRRRVRFGDMSPELVMFPELGRALIAIVRLASMHDLDMFLEVLIRPKSFVALVAAVLLCRFVEMSSLVSFQVRLSLETSFAFVADEGLFARMRPDVFVQTRRTRVELVAALERACKLFDAAARARQLVDWRQSVFDHDKLTAAL